MMMLMMIWMMIMMATCPRGLDGGSQEIKMESTKSSVKIGIQNSRIGTVTSFYKWLIFIFSVSHVLSPTSLVKVVEELQSDKFWQNDVCCPNGERKQSKLLLGKLTKNLPRKRNLPTSSRYQKEQQRFGNVKLIKKTWRERESLRVGWRSWKGFPGSAIY